MSLRTLALLSAVTFLSDAVIANENPCKNSETLIASCTLIENKKQLSLCENNNQDQISYHVGSFDHTEARVIFSKHNPMHRWIDAQTNVTFLGFTLSDRTYVLGVPQETYGARAFLFIKAKNAPIDFNAPLFCTSNSFGHKNRASEAILDSTDESVRKSGFIFPPHRQ
jgi:hypothetical protein